MKSHNNYAAETFTGDVIDTFSAGRGFNTLLASRQLKLLQEDALIEASKNRCRALLAQSAINDTASLAMTVDRLSLVAPEGKYYYQRILKAYAETTAHNIERWC